MGVLHGAPVGRAGQAEHPGQHGGAHAGLGLARRLRPACVWHGRMHRVARSARVAGGGGGGRQQRRRLPFPLGRLDCAPAACVACTVQVLCVALEGRSCCLATSLNGAGPAGACDRPLGSSTIFMAARWLSENVQAAIGPALRTRPASGAVSAGGAPRRRLSALRLPTLVDRLTGCFATWPSRLPPSGRCQPPPLTRWRRPGGLAACPARARMPARSVPAALACASCPSARRRRRLAARRSRPPWLRG